MGVSMSGESSADLTLEKARVVERLGGLETGFNELNLQVQVFISESKAFRETTSKSLESLTDSQKTLTKILTGNGSGVGLIEESRRAKEDIKNIQEEIETAKKQRSSHSWAIIICVLSAITGVVGQVIVTHLK